MFMVQYLYCGHQTVLSLLHQITQKEASKLQIKQQHQKLKINWTLTHAHDFSLKGNKFSLGTFREKIRVSYLKLNIFSSSLAITSAIMIVP